MPKLRRIGEVSSDGGSLTLIAGDALEVAKWGAMDIDDYERACDALHGLEAPGQAIAWSEGKGIFTDLGGAGVADVFRIGPDELLLAPFYAAEDWSTATE